MKVWFLVLTIILLTMPGLLVQGLLGSLADGLLVSLVVIRCLAQVVLHQLPAYMWMIGLLSVLLWVVVLKTAWQTKAA